MLLGHDLPACTQNPSSSGRLHLPFLGSRNPAKRGFEGIMWGAAPLDTLYYPTLVGDNRPDAIALLSISGNTIYIEYNI